jgi:hypothetical protein
MLRLLSAVLLLSRASAWMLPLRPAAVASPRAVSPVMLDFKWLKGVFSGGEPEAPAAVPAANAGAKAEEVCYLEEEGEFMSYKCGPYAPPDVPEWYLDFDWPSGTAQAARAAQTREGA